MYSGDEAKGVKGGGQLNESRTNGLYTCLHCKEELSKNDK